MFGTTIVRGLLTVTLMASAVTVWAGTISIATVPVGDAGNQPDTTGFGEVDYNYNIGTYDVTNNQYAAFLSAVATSNDPYGLWKSSMASDAEGGINRTGSGPYSYAVKSGQGNQPVAEVSWYDAVRFVNWLTNGQPIGVEGNGTTESGTYLITNGGNNSGTVIVPTTAQRRLGRQWQWCGLAVAERKRVVQGFLLRGGRHERRLLGLSDPKQHGPDLATTSG